MLNFFRFIAIKFLSIQKLYWIYKIRTRCKACHTHIYIGGSSSVNSETVLGEHFSTNGMVVKGNGPAVFGNYVHTGADLLLLTSNHRFRGALLIPYDEQFIHKSVIVGDAVWIGDRVTILGGVKIGKGAIIQAGSVVVFDIPDYAIAGGNPAQVFAYRNKEEFDQLYEKSKFLTV
jgi:chloramphenicol O-acetyltransferase type B